MVNKEKKDKIVEDSHSNIKDAFDSILHTEFEGKDKLVNALNELQQRVMMLNVLIDSDIKKCSLVDNCCEELGLEPE